MNTKFILTLLIFLPFIIFAQNEQQNNTCNITIEELKDHMYYLASDDLKGRYTGEAGYNKAVEYAVSQFKRAGLKPIIVDKNGDSTFLQRVPFIKYNWDSTNTIIIKKKKVKHKLKQSVNYALLSGKPFDQTKLQGDVVFVSAGLREPEYGIDNYANVDVKGKWVVTYLDAKWLDKFLPENIIAEKYTDAKTYNNIIFKNAKDAGAIGMIGVISKKMLPHFPKWTEVYKQLIKVKGVESDFLNVDYPLLVIDSVFTTALFDKTGFNPIENDTLYESFELNKTKLTLNKNALVSEFDSYNIVAKYEGEEPSFKNEYLTLGAHLDHIGTMDGAAFNGADDNASGSIGVMEIAEEIKLSGSKRPVLFILYTAEEMGLLGSEYFVSNSPVQLSQIMVNINLDMISRSDGDVEKGIAPINANKIDEVLKNEIINTHNKYPLVEIDWAYADTTQFAGSSDHYSFHKKGIPSVFFFSGDHADYHDIGDDPEKIDYDFFAKNCRFVYHLLHELGNKEKLQLLPAD